MSAMIILGAVGSLLVVFSLWSSTYYLCCGVTVWILILMVPGLWGYFSVGLTLCVPILFTVVLLSWSFYQKEEINMLWLFVLLGTLMVMASDHWLLTYLGLELQTLSLFMVVTYPGLTMSTTEAGLKFFVLGALSSGFFLFGCLGVFLDTGTLWISSSCDCLSLCSSSFWSYSFLVCSILFKLGVVPFHFWLPDVYQGLSPQNVMLMSTVPKIGAWFLLSKLGMTMGWMVLGVGGSMIVGSLGAINQSSLFSLVAYSGILHMGFMLWPLSYSSDHSFSISSFYLLVYLMSVVIWVGSLLPFSMKKWSMVELSGIYSSFPLLGLTQLLVLFSLAGVPPLMGFFAKWWVIQQAVVEGYVFLAMVSVLVTMMGASYYLKMVNVILFQAGSSFSSWNSALSGPSRLSLSQSLWVALGLFLIVGFMANPFLLLYLGHWACIY